MTEAQIMSDAADNMQRAALHFETQVTRFLTGLKLQAELESMKAMNKHREMIGSALAYGEADFSNLADRLSGV